VPAPEVMRLRVREAAELAAEVPTSAKLAQVPPPHLLPGKIHQQEFLLVLVAAEAVVEEHQTWPEDLQAFMAAEVVDQKQQAAREGRELL
jgi:hypothetical protein